MPYGMMLPKERYLMIVLTADALKEHIDSIPGIRSYKRRFCYDQFRELVVNTRDPKVVALYGLIKTGKKTLMAQLIMDIAQYDNICLIKCTEGDGIRDLFAVIDKHEDCEYFFIDEAARLKNFSMEGYFLADYFSLGDHRIIVSASDSLAFYLARIDNFFDRFHTIHTTYISYKEYNYLLGRSLDDYMQHGGTLTPENDFSNSKTTIDYSSCAIAENMVHSIEDLGKRGGYGTLAIIRRMNKLATFVYMLTERYNRQFVIQALKTCIENNDALENAVKKTVFDELSLIADMSVYDITSTTSIFRVFGENEILQATTRTNEYLRKLDIIYHVPYSDDLIFTQPGYRYNQCADIIDVLMKKFNTVFSDEQLKELTIQLENEIRDRMLEDIVWYQLFTDKAFSKDFKINKFSKTVFAGESGLAIISKRTWESYVIKVKYSDKAEDKQTLPLCNNVLCEAFEKKVGGSIIGKLVLYTGEPMKEKQHDVSYVNVEEFLMAPERFLDTILECKNKPAFCPPWGSYLDA